jgi:hypothetical protein
MGRKFSSEDSTDGKSEHQENQGENIILEELKDMTLYQIIRKSEKSVSKERMITRIEPNTLKAHDQSQIPKR